MTTMTAAQALEEARRLLKELADWVHPNNEPDWTDGEQQVKFQALREKARRALASRLAEQEHDSPQPESAAPKVPEGWVLVPREPTPEMLNALEDIDTPQIANAEQMSWQDYQRIRWRQIIDRAMLSAAPTNEDQR